MGLTSTTTTTLNIFRHLLFSVMNNDKKHASTLALTRLRNGSLLSNPRTVTVMSSMEQLKYKLLDVGITCDDSCSPGLYHRSLCPKCRGGALLERSLSLHINEEGDFAMWRCFRVDCGWAGRAFAGSDNVRRSMSSKQITKKGLGLEPLGEELIAYFSARMISEATLCRNSVMQLSGAQVVMAFPYKKDGLIVGCKYRTVGKKFWQERGTERWLYGLDDITDAAEIIIVEGEIDKLAVEEAGFQNCVSIPCGAPLKVSDKELPPQEKDTGYQYLWNCKEYLDKASRIVLATDADEPGQALAEELARRLGKDRCWHVRWPKKDDILDFNDANEVLNCLGAVALKEAIENAVQRCSVQDMHSL